MRPRTRHVEWLAAAAGIGALALAFQPVRPGPVGSPPQQVEARSGHVARWRLTANGTLFVLLEPAETPEEAEDDPETLWLQTPGEQTSTVDFEDMLHVAILAAMAEPRAAAPFTFYVRKDPVKDGSAPEKAMQIAYVERGRE
jgi:hypothetical protein